MKSYETKFIAPVQYCIKIKLEVIMTFLVQLALICYTGSLLCAVETVDPRLRAAELRLASDPWETIWQANESGPRATFTVDTTKVNSAPSSLCLMVPEGAGAANSRITVFAVSDGLQAGDIQITGMRRLQGGPQAIAVVSVFGYDSNWKRLSDQSLCVVNSATADDQWTSFSGTATLPAGLNAVVLQVAIVEGAGSLWLDDLCVTKAPLSAR